MATQEQVRRWAEALIRIHLNAEWSFGFDHARRRAGLCNYTHKKISVSKYLLEQDDDDIYQVLLHEIAHALAGSRTGHGSKWLRIAREIGYTGGRTHSIPMAQEAAHWLGVCSKGHAIKRFRRPTKAVSCASCSPTFNQQYAFSWKRVEEPVHVNQ